MFLNYPTTDHFDINLFEDNPYHLMQIDSAKLFIKFGLFQLYVSEANAKSQAVLKQVITTIQWSLNNAFHAPGHL